MCALAVGYAVGFFCAMSVDIARSHAVYAAQELASYQRSDAAQRTMDRERAVMCACGETYAAEMLPK